MRDARPVLVVTQVEDSTADLVISLLHERDVPVVRLNPGDFPAGVKLSAEFTSDGLRGHLTTPTRTLDVSGVRSVWWRRPTPYTSPPGLDAGAAAWATAQARRGLGGVLAGLPEALYVNHPWRNRDADHKPAQLAAAGACGLSVLPTLVTNEPATARMFAARQRRIVYKPVDNADYRTADGKAQTVWVEEVTADELDESLAGTVHLFQKALIDKVADIRTTVVGEQVFSVRIDGAPGLDWRHDYSSLTYTDIPTPPHIHTAIRTYLNHFGLVFGAFDFGLDRDGTWWMYECNSNGQWAWFPPATTNRIATALADLLQEGQPRS
jgi:ATP-grasp ribosomal peptide maturase